MLRDVLWDLVDGVHDFDAVITRLKLADGDAVKDIVREADREMDGLPLQSVVTVLVMDMVRVPDGVADNDLDIPEHVTVVERVRVGTRVRELLVLHVALRVREAVRATLCDELHVCDREDTVAEGDGM